MKHRFTKISLLSLSLGALLFASCTKKADNGNATIQFQAQANNSTYTMNGSSITPVSSSSSTTGLSLIHI